MTLTLTPTQVGGLTLTLTLTLSLQDLRRCNWVPRREVFTAKKLDEIRGQAEAELGMISTNIAASLPTLPSQQRAGPGARMLQAGCASLNAVSAPLLWPACARC